MQFVLIGFTQDRGYRVFAFDGISADRVRIAFTVRADLDLSRRYGIRQQELPLICREVLEHQGDGDRQHAVTFTEDAMKIHATTKAEQKASASANRKPPRRAPRENMGTAWRGPQP
jgi:hypothetical protein